jgi:hypothetical protein
MSPRTVFPEPEEPDDQSEALAFRLTRDLRKAAAEVTLDQARYLVDLYYQVQEGRKAADNQRRASEAAGEPREFFTWVTRSFHDLEGAIKAGLAAYVEEQVPGRWALSQVGVGPVLAAGLLAHIDVDKARTAGAVWRFAGLDPTVSWEKRTKRPWNAKLKVLCWKLGESFVKNSGREGCLYGQLWAQRKALEEERNLAGAFAAQAADKLARFKIGRTTEAYRHYAAGRLPPAHLHARAKRWAVKLFLAHYHHVAYESRFGTPPPKPYVIDVLGHGDYMAPPNWPMKD